MPKDKDLKRVVRTRMTKTGESYTAARRNVAGSVDESERRTRLVFTVDVAHAAAHEHSSSARAVMAAGRKLVAYLKEQGFDVRAKNLSQTSLEN